MTCGVGVRLWGVGRVGGWVGGCSRLLSCHFSSHWETNILSLLCADYFTVVNTLALTYTFPKCSHGAILPLDVSGFWRVHGGGGLGLRAGGENEGFRLLKGARVEDWVWGQEEKMRADPHHPHHKQTASNIRSRSSVTGASAALADEERHVRAVR